MANFVNDGEKSDFKPQKKDGSPFTNYVSTMFDPNLTWKDIDWLKRFEFS